MQWGKQQGVMKNKLKMKVNGKGYVQKQPKRLEWKNKEKICYIIYQSKIVKELRNVEKKHFYHR